MYIEITNMNVNNTTNLAVEKILLDMYIENL